MTCEGCKRRRERMLEVGRTVAGSYQRQREKLRLALLAAEQRKDKEVDADADDRTGSRTTR